MVKPLVLVQLTNKNNINTYTISLLVLEQIDNQIVHHYSLLELFAINFWSTDMAE